MPWKYKYPRTKKCTTCGKEFMTIQINRKLCDDCQAVYLPKYKSHCEICGRRVRNSRRIPLDSTEKLFCSFCTKAEKDRIAKLKYEQQRFNRQAKPCAVCGKMAILVKRNNVCAECYFKDRFPTATKVEEV